MKPVGKIRRRASIYYPTRPTGQASWVVNTGAEYVHPRLV